MDMVERATIEQFIHSIGNFGRYRDRMPLRMAQGEPFVLNYLYCHGSAQPSQISVAMQVSTARITTILNGLEKREMVVRRPDETDRRKINVCLTEQGVGLCGPGPGGNDGGPLRDPDPPGPGGYGGDAPPPGPADGDLRPASPRKVTARAFRGDISGEIPPLARKDLLLSFSTGGLHCEGTEQTARPGHRRLRRRHCAEPVSAVPGHQDAGI